MVSMPKVNPGDMVFWHADVVHAVEEEHTGSGDSAGEHYFVLQGGEVELTHFI
jgi:ectoine hydroxylase-related dioxygenase (phytanoyl-CoA dioxygenase family)